MFCLACAPTCATIRAMPKPDEPNPTEVPARRFVRVLDRPANGLVKFEFAIGWPDLSCELALPAAVFDDFCQRHAVEFLTEPDHTPGLHNLSQE
jgi:hypothetical protein